ncbi:hypothetical protein AQI95_05450 [Streptomyces yokosukanensis]|uniref:Uncharacterized protein n=1 Tax=Streptomyces yokosukanensis TaxID=67386 RepID=A0A117Q4V4_9ACTN|nr:hypothetical protein [Streptomyces yokosukanensis]KUN09279.1 hypothetical protein AQI95_05450 [Streptomyces yokosukanensis]
MPLQETLARHRTKPDPTYLTQVTDQHLGDWYRERDLLPSGIETVIDAGSSLPETVRRIMRETDLDQVPAIDRCRSGTPDGHPAPGADGRL